MKTSKAKRRGGARLPCQVCQQPVMPIREFSDAINDNRRRLIRVNEKKWANGTVLRYTFMTKRGWRGSASELEVVRSAFQRWQRIGIGLSFLETDDADEAEIRIGFERGDGAWSYLGRDILDQAQSERTMNFGWNIRTDPDTALHEIGHTLGFPHEHQNPNAGIEWNEPAVYDDLAAAPNFWDRQTTFWNILRKLPQSEVDGSDWDKDSIMHYPFAAGLIDKPELYQSRALLPKPGLSPNDKRLVKRFYPPIKKDEARELRPFRSIQAKLQAGEQINFRIEPGATRHYQFETFGKSDSVMVLFEEVDGELRYRAGDDDSGENLNASLEEKLFKGRRYTLRVRLYWQHRHGDFAVMMW